MTTVSPTTVSGNTVVGEGISFDLTLTGGSPYTYTCTFDTYDVVINNDTATVTIIPWTSGTLTGSITFDNQATCNITIDVAPTPEGFEPATITETMNAYDIKDFVFRLLGYDEETETVEYSYSVDSEIELSISNISGDSPNPDGYRVTIETENETEQALVGNVYVIARIYDKITHETLREYTATINLTIQSSEPTPSVVTVTPTTVSENGVVGQSTSFNLTLTGGTTYTYTQTFGNICSVSINENIATVTITPTTSGTLTGSITFNNEATCNISINVTEPTPTRGLHPSTVTYTMNAQESKNIDFTLVEEYDSETEGVYYECFIGDSLSPLNSSISSLSGQPLTNPDGYRVTIESDNQTGQASVGIVYVVATIYDKPSEETLRDYTAEINLTIQPL